MTKSYCNNKKCMNHLKAYMEELQWIIFDAQSLNVFDGEHHAVCDSGYMLGMTMCRISLGWHSTFNSTFLHLVMFYFYNIAFHNLIFRLWNRSSCSLNWPVLRLCANTGQYHLRELQRLIRDQSMCFVFTVQCVHLALTAWGLHITHACNYQLWRWFPKLEIASSS